MSAAPSSDYTLFVGCSTGRIATLTFSPDASSLHIMHSSERGGKNPCWITCHPTAERVLFTCDDADARVTAFEIAPSGELRLLQTIDAGAAGTVTVDVACNGRYIAMANYAGESCSTTCLLPNGIPWPHSLLVHPFTLEQPGPHPERQSKSVPHQAMYDPSGRFLFVADLGADLVRVFSSAPDSGTGSLEALPPIPLDSGAGPRHMAFYQPPSSHSKSTRATHLYVISELANTVSVLALDYPDEAKVEARHLQTVSTLLSPPPEGHAAFASELAVHSELGLLFAGNRYRKADDGSIGDQDDDVAVFAIHDTERTLSPLRKHSLAAKNAKHFDLAPNGEWLAVAAKGDGVVVIFSVQGWREMARIPCEGASVVRWWPRRVPLQDT